MKKLLVGFAYRKFTFNKHFERNQLKRGRIIALTVHSSYHHLINVTFTRVCSD